MKRGGYSGDQRYELKFRANPALYETIKGISEQQGCAMALVIRKFVIKGLEREQEKGRPISKA